MQILLVSALRPRRLDLLDPLAQCGCRFLIAPCIFLFGLFDLSFVLIELCRSLTTILSIDLFYICSAVAKVVGANLAPSAVTLSFIFLW